jgi:hypothetical protein
MHGRMNRIMECPACPAATFKALIFMVLLYPEDARHLESIRDFAHLFDGVARSHRMEWGHVDDSEWPERTGPTLCLDADEGCASCPNAHRAHSHEHRRQHISDRGGQQAPAGAARGRGLLDQRLSVRAACLPRQICRPACSSLTGSVRHLLPCIGNAGASARLRGDRRWRDGRGIEPTAVVEISLSLRIPLFSAPRSFYLAMRMNW